MKSDLSASLQAALETSSATSLRDFALLVNLDELVQADSLKSIRQGYPSFLVLEHQLVDRVLVDGVQPWVPDLEVN